MLFDRDAVDTVLEHITRNRHSGKILLGCAEGHIGLGVGVVRDGTFRHVHALYFGSVDVDDGTVVDANVEGKLEVSADGAQVHVTGEVGRDGSLGGGEHEGGSGVAVAPAQRAGSVLPL